MSTAREPKHDATVKNAYKREKETTAPTTHIHRLHAERKTVKKKVYF
jgi:hypothetical protein